MPKRAKHNLLSLFIIFLIILFVLSDSSAFCVDSVILRSKVTPKGQFLGQHQIKQFNESKKRLAEFRASLLKQWAQDENVSQMLQE